MAIKGSLAEAALSNVIQLLAISLKSGCLSVTDGKNLGNLFIKDGKIIYATILNRKQRLGDILISKKEINKEILNQALDIQKSQRKKRLGEILIEVGAITRKTLESELTEQIEQTIFTMLTWESGYFNFEAELLPSLEEYTVELSPQEVLLEAARRIDEWRKIENKMPPFETILTPKGNAKDIPLTVQEKKIVELIDGKRSIDEILRISEFEFFEICRAIYGLLSAGLLEKPEKPIMKEVREVSEAKNLGLSFYKRGMYNDAEREYRKIFEIDGDNAEAIAYLGLIELRRGNCQAARENFLKTLRREERLSVLINLGYICSTLKLYNEAITYLDLAKKLAPEDTKIRCNLGIVFYKQDNLDEAYEIFKEIIEKSPEFITPYIYLSVIDLKKGNGDKALNRLHEAIDRFPKFAALRNNLAVIYENTERLEEAEKLYRQALEIEPKDIILCRNLGDFYYEAQILGAAKELYERIPDDHKEWQVLFKLGQINLRQGDSDQALHFWERAQALNPAEESIAKNIAVLQRSDKK